MSSHLPNTDIFALNPYDSHPSLSPLEAAVLWEYAKLAQNVRMQTVLFLKVTQKTRLLSEEPDKVMLAKLRILEKKMGLVLTLFKASVWGVINDQPDPSIRSEGFSDANDMTIRR
ncbi:DASH complex subunit dad3 [Psilocybe cubensis]|uniref:DASH complex subunit DAD3 n=2 Tax=Psilocybe cubensis TaxID=181762 RepID=A0A8H8CMY2_PSICU|nr:DASH complex subunit dad3 [Psilocybe cubensis]KAH9483942.1 DASH complex subunit dad3 [Psilocybe cubensis]